MFKIDFVKGISIPANLSPQNHSKKAELIPDSNKREPDEKFKRPAKLHHQGRKISFSVSTQVSSELAWKPIVREFGLNKSPLVKYLFKGYYLKAVSCLFPRRLYFR